MSDLIELGVDYIPSCTMVDKMVEEWFEIEVGFLELQDSGLDIPFQGFNQEEEIYK